MARAGTTFWDTADEVLTGVTQVVAGVGEVVSAFGSPGDNPPATPGQITGATTVRAPTEPKPFPFEFPFKIRVEPTTVILIGGGVLALIFLSRFVR